MFTWKAIRARLAQALEVLAMGAGPQPAVVILERAQVEARRGLIQRLEQARTVRQVLELQTLAVQWGLGPELMRQVEQAAVKALARVPTHGPSFPKSSL
jgi:hypothetical protein